jgi:Matrixin
MNRTFRTLRLTTAVAVATLSALAAAPSHAYRMIQNTSTGRVSAGAAVTCNNAGGFTHWNIRNIAWYHNTANQGSGKATPLTNALNSWTAVTSADHVLTYAGTTTAGWSTDGRNTFLWASGNGCTGSCLALTALVLQSGQVIVETDVTFNNNVTWTTTGSNYDTESVAAHEVGHALGIHHTNLSSSPQPTMAAIYFGSGGRSLETDDRSALQCAESRY